MANHLYWRDTGIARTSRFLRFTRRVAKGLKLTPRVFFAQPFGFFLKLVVVLDGCVIVVFFFFTKWSRCAVRAPPRFWHRADVGFGEEFALRSQTEFDVGQRDEDRGFASAQVVREQTFELVRRFARFDGARVVRGGCYRGFVRELFVFGVQVVLADVREEFLPERLFD